ncbi:MAG: sugar phosphate isomerase/epimerase [Planctomycetaceae bacterium]
MRHSNSRRRFLQHAGATLAAASLAPLSLATAAEEKQPAKVDPYGGFKMGIQSYSLRGYKVEEALKHTQELGLAYWEAYPNHVPVSSVPAEVEKQKAMLADHGVTLLAYGVVGFDSNETNARKIFDFAKAIGLTSISANPKKEAATFDLLDKLVAEYEIPIAIHNHGPGAEYDKIADVVEWTKDRHALIGACVDTGHYLRSDENPVDAIKTLGARVFGVHLKDVRTIKGEDNKKPTRLMTILGEGDLDIVGCLRELRAINFANCLSIEYEENAQNPLSDIKTCLDNVQAAVKKLA